MVFGALPALGRKEDRANLISAGLTCSTPRLLSLPSSPEVPPRIARYDFGRRIVRGPRSIRLDGPVVTVHSSTFAGSWTEIAHRRGAPHPRPVGPSLPCAQPADVRRERLARIRYSERELSIGGLVSANGHEVTDDRIQPELQAFLEGAAHMLRAAITSDPEIVNLPWQGDTMPGWRPNPLMAGIRPSS